MLAGSNPFAIDFPNLYGPGSPVYAPELMDGDRLAFGFPYPPLSLLLALPGYLLGDLRWSHHAALTTAGALIAYARPGRVAPTAAALLLFSPRAFYVLEGSWTEPFLLLALAVVVFAAGRSPWVLSAAIGALFVAKQYVVPAAPLTLLLAPWLPRRGIALATTVAVGTTLPFVIWEPSAFVHSVVGVHLAQPFRPDALSFAAWAYRRGYDLPWWLPFALGAAALVLALARLPRTAAGFAAGVALVEIVLFAFGKQAFENYYLFAVGACCCAVAAAASIPEAGR